MTLLENGTPAWPTITDGNKNTGTVINVTGIWDPIKDAIDGLIHSTTNPTVAPNAAIDELILARGSKATLKARLDVITNADGTLKSGVVTVQTEVETARGSQASLDARLDNGLNEDGTPIVCADGVTGAVNSSDQVMGGGVKTFKKTPKFHQGSSAAADAYTSGRVHTDTTTVSTVGTGEDNLITYTLPANSLDTDGKVIRVTVWGSFAANANNKTVKAYFGATSITLFNGAINNVSWVAEVRIVRTGAATQVMLASVQQGAAASSLPARVLPAETLSGAVVIKCTGEATTDGDIAHNGMIVEVVG